MSCGAETSEMFARWRHFWSPTKMKLKPPAIYFNYFHMERSRREKRTANITRQSLAAGFYLFDSRDDVIPTTFCENLKLKEISFSFDKEAKVEYIHKVDRFDLCRGEARTGCDFGAKTNTTRRGGRRISSPTLFSPH
jgi:hypothetical protein